MLGLGGMRKHRYCPHGIRDVGSRLVRKPLQTPYHFAKWPHPIGLILVKRLNKSHQSKVGRSYLRSRQID